MNPATRTAREHSAPPTRSTAQRVVLAAAAVPYFVAKGALKAAVSATRKVYLILAFVGYAWLRGLVVEPPALDASPFTLRLMDTLVYTGILLLMSRELWRNLRGLAIVSAAGIQWVRRLTLRTKGASA